MTNYLVESGSRRRGFAPGVEDELPLASSPYRERYRYYDPTVGRFVSEDPAGFEAGDSNLYRYVGNDPISKRDPTGLCGQSSNSAFFGSATFGGSYFSPVVSSTSSSGWASNANWIDTSELGSQDWFKSHPMQAVMLPTAPADGDASNSWGGYSSTPLEIGAIRFSAAEWSVLNPAIFNGKAIGQVGWVYGGLNAGTNQGYVGSATLGLSDRMSNHAQIKFFEQPGTEITVWRVYGSPDLEAVDTPLRALRRTTFSQEALVAVQWGKDGIRLLNQQPVLTPENQVEFEVQNLATMGSPTKVKVAGESLDVAVQRMRQMDVQAGLVPGAAAKIQAGVLNTVNAVGYPLVGLDYWAILNGQGGSQDLAIGPLNPAREKEVLRQANTAPPWTKNLIIEAPMVFEDVMGEFTVSEPSWRSWLLGDLPNKQYISGEGARLNKGEWIPILDREWKEIKKQHEEQYKQRLDVLKWEAAHPGTEAI